MFTDPYIGVITVFAGNFAPLSYMYCQGQLLQISQYDALFALIGTTYGGDGQVTFALPDFRGRVAVHAGQAPGMGNYALGQVSGTETITLATANLATHSHQYSGLTGAPAASANNGNLGTPVNNVPAATSGINSYNAGGTGTMAKSTNNVNSAIAGSSQPFNNASPVLAMNYIIAVEGIFPTRN